MNYTKYFYISSAHIHLPIVDLVNTFIVWGILFLFVHFLSFPPALDTNHRTWRAIRTLQTDGTAPLAGRLTPAPHPFVKWQARRETLNHHHYHHRTMYIYVH